MASEQMALAFAVEPFMSRTAMNKGAKVIAVCRNCERDFVTLAKQIRRGQGLFCSLSCHTSNVAKRTNPLRRGERNPNWKGGVSKDNLRYVKRFRAKSPEKVAVQKLFRAAVLSGRIVPATECSACGIACKAHGHHDDYSKPYEVRWLCQPCHNRHHAQQRKAS